MEKGNGLNFRIAIDGTMILMFVFSAGVFWTKLNDLDVRMTQMQTSLANSPLNAERLARVEEKLDRLIRDVDKLQNKVDK